MKARKVKGIDPTGSLAESALRIVAVRLDELRSFSTAVRDPAAVTELHDMRIAAKRLRYILEMTAPALGPAARQGAKDARKLQDALGEIHDCDEFAPRVEAHIARLRAEDTAVVRAAAGARSRDLDPAAVRDAPNRLLYRGLETLDVYIRARRQVLYSRFLREWERLEADRLGPALLDRLRGSTIERRDGHG
jgi:CHAD domain